MSEQTDSRTEEFECEEPDCGVVMGAAGPIDPDEPDYFAEEVEEHRRAHRLDDDQAEADRAPAWIPDAGLPDGVELSDASPDYAGRDDAGEPVPYSETVAGRAYARILTYSDALDERPIVEPTTVRMQSAARVLAAGVLAAGIVGGACGYAIGRLDAPARTEVLALAQPCVDRGDAAERVIAAYADIEALEGMFEMAAIEFDATFTSTSKDGDDVMESLDLLDDVKESQDRADKDRAAAEREFRDANNRCITEIDRREAGR